jgi:hypothetical protein
MKGVLLGICRDATLVDITHEVPVHDVLAGAFELAAAYRYFPPGTIFLTVVDPGVGSSRRGLAIRAGDYIFVGPDNGVFSVVLAAEPVRVAVQLAKGPYARSTISRTFEGRDLFAPAAAWLAIGIDITHLGPSVSDVFRLETPSPVLADDRIVGQVIRVDRFGNLISNIDRAMYATFATSPVGAEMPGRSGIAIVTTYSDAEPGEVCALFGSTDHLEIAANGASAEAVLGVGRGAPVHVVRRA